VLLALLPCCATSGNGRLRRFPELCNTAPSTVRRRSRVSKELMVALPPTLTVELARSCVAAVMDLLLLCCGLE
jgi:hypothetical protein